MVLEGVNQYRLSKVVLACVVFARQIVPPRGFMYAYSAPSNTAKATKILRGGRKAFGGRRTSGGGKKGCIHHFPVYFVLVVDPFQVINNYSRSSGSASTTSAGRRQPAVPML